MKLIKLALGGFLLSMMVGCSIVTPNYQPDFTNINEMKDLDLPKMQSGEFTQSRSALESISLRGSPLVSSYGSYPEYLRKALEEELKQADLWRTPSDIVISGKLLEHDIDATGFSVGETDISARFSVLISGKEVYSKIHTIHHVWDSSFVGAVAIPNAANSYPIGVQKLMTKLFSDQELLNVLNR